MWKAQCQLSGAISWVGGGTVPEYAGQDLAWNPLEANDPPSSMYSIDSFDSPIDTFDRRYFWVWPCKGCFIEAGIEAGTTVFEDL